VTPDLTVVIPTRGRQRLLARVLDHLEHQADAPAFEVVVVADAKEDDRDGVAAAIGERPFEVRQLAAARAGASAARNVGWRAAEAPLIAFLGDDTLPAPRHLAEHAAWHSEHSQREVAVLGQVRWADEIRVTPFMRWLDTCGIQFDYERLDASDDVDVGWGRFYTANVSIKRGLLDAAGGFDEERLPFLYEDLDLAYRLRPLGFRLLYNRAASVQHVHPVTVEDWKNRAAAVAEAERTFVRLHPEVEPYFHDLFSPAAAWERAPSGRGVRLAGVVPEWVPWVGPRVRSSAEATWRYTLAREFMAGWERAA
jgi:GT2 family glycosyltransferase